MDAPDMKIEYDIEPLIIFGLLVEQQAALQTLHADSIMDQYNKVAPRFVREDYLFHVRKISELTQRLSAIKESWKESSNDKAT